MTYGLKKHRCDKKNNTIFRINILEKRKIKLFKSHYETIYVRFAPEKKYIELYYESFIDSRDIPITPHYNNRVIWIATN